MNTTPSEMTSGQATNSEQSVCSFSIRNVRTQDTLARFAGDEQRYRHWLFEFISHGPAATAHIRQAIADGSPDTAIKLAHALKGQTGMLGMAELHSLALSLEMALRNCEPTAFWLEELELTVNQMCQEIHVVLGENTA